MVSVLQAPQLQQIGEQLPPFRSLEELQTRITEIFTFCICFLQGFIATFWELAFDHSAQFNPEAPPNHTLYSAANDTFDPEIAVFGATENPPTEEVRCQSHP